MPGRSSRHGRPQSRYGRRHRHGYQSAGSAGFSGNSTPSSNSSGDLSDSSSASSSDGTASAQVSFNFAPRYAFTAWDIVTVRRIIATALEKEDPRDIWILSKKNLDDSVRWYFFSPPSKNKAYYMGKLAKAATKQVKKKALGEIPLIGPAVKSVYNAVHAAEETNAKFQGNMIGQWSNSDDDLSMNSNMMALFRAAGQMEYYGWIEQRAGTKYWLKYTKIRGRGGDGDLYRYFLNEASLYSWEIPTEYRPPLDTSEGLYFAGQDLICASDRKKGFSGEYLDVVPDGTDNPVVARASKAVDKLKDLNQRLSGR